MTISAEKSIGLEIQSDVFSAGPFNFFQGIL